MSDDAWMGLEDLQGMVNHARPCDFPPLFRDVPACACSAPGRDNYSRGCAGAVPCHAVLVGACGQTDNSGQYA